MRVGKDFKYVLVGVTKEVLASTLKSSNGFCPCDIEPTKKCMCDELKNSPVGTTCFCGVFKKIEVE